MYLGMQNQVYTFIMFDLQALLAQLFVTKSFRIPGKQEMLADIAWWLEKQTQVVEVKDWHAFQTEYVRELNALTKFGDEKDILCQKAFDDSEDDKVKDILHFRNGIFYSSFSGSSGTPPLVPWLQASEELSLKDYLGSLSVHSEGVLRMTLDEYAVVEQQMIERWGIDDVHDSDSVGKFIAPGCRVPAGEVVMVLPPYNIQRWHEVVDNDMVIQVRGGGKEKALFSCANSRDTMDCYLNHSCEPNLKAVVLGDYAVHMVALREIEAGEVLAWDYQSTEEDLVAFEADFSCQCGSAKCKGHIKGYSH
jgi:hypothetical protein